MVVSIDPGKPVQYLSGSGINLGNYLVRVKDRPKDELIWAEILYTPTSISSEIGRCRLDEKERSLYYN